MGLEEGSGPLGQPYLSRHQQMSHLNGEVEGPEQGELRATVRLQQTRCLAQHSASLLWATARPVQSAHTVQSDMQQAGLTEYRVTCSKQASRSTE